MAKRQTKSVGIDPATIFDGPLLEPINGNVLLAACLLLEGPEQEEALERARGVINEQKNKKYSILAAHYNIEWNETDDNLLGWAVIGMGLVRDLIPGLKVEYNIPKPLKPGRKKERDWKHLYDAVNGLLSGGVKSIKEACRRLKKAEEFSDYEVGTLVTRYNDFRKLVAKPDRNTKH